MGIPPLHSSPTKQLRHPTYWNVPSSRHSPSKVEWTLTPQHWWLHPPGKREPRQSFHRDLRHLALPMYPDTSPSTHHDLLYSGHCSLPTAPSINMSIYTFLPLAGGVFLHKSLILSICLSRSDLGFKQLKPYFLQEDFPALYSSLTSFSKAPFNTICCFSKYHHKPFVNASWALCHWYRTKLQTPWGLESCLIIVNCP